jgi:hypothetical protein
MKPRVAVLMGAVVLLVAYSLLCRQLAKQASVALCDWLATDVLLPPATVPPLGEDTLRRLWAIQKDCAGHCVCELGDTPHAESLFEHAIWVSSPKAQNAIALRYAARWPKHPRVLGFWTPP